ncbi:hypothetical protein L1987_18181 [Smallanthus sonchifolius]|uniref:Uncharacterized protein n=1 Tax=Smallanthus sonchifolius TaxID=185202 RepID=A0ACB9J020_9ASTR|nr:hypothetical protein L1987_18181 [Smallanthus sonchifolius]
MDILHPPHKGDTCKPLDSKMTIGIPSAAATGSRAANPRFRTGIHVRSKSNDFPQRGRGVVSEEDIQKRFVTLHGGSLINERLGSADESTERVSVMADLWNGASTVSVKPGNVN